MSGHRARNFFVFAVAVVAGLVLTGTAFGWRDVSIEDWGFVPAVVSGDGKQDLQWTNYRNQTQSVTADDGTFDSGPIPPGGGFSMKLQVPGRHGYHSTNSQDKGTVTVSRRSLEGPPEDLVAHHIPDIPFPPAQASDIGLQPLWGVPASMTRILLGFKPGATVAQANAALDAADVTVEGALSDTGILLVKVPQNFDLEPFDNLAATLAKLRADVSVDFAAMSLVGGPQAVPRGSGDAAATNDYPWSWESTGVRGNWGLEAARFPQAWNFLESIRRKSPSTITGIVDSGFDAQHPDLASNLTVANQVCAFATDCRDLVNHPDAHGNHVAGIIGAAYDNDLAPPQESRSLGVSGGNPFARMQAYPDADFFGNQTVLGGAARLNDRQLELFDLILRSRPASMRILNYSSGAATFVDTDNKLYKNSAGETIWWKSFPVALCGPGPADDDLPIVDHLTEKELCTPDNEDSWLREFSQVGRAAARIAEAASRDGVMIVESAGNDSASFCRPGCTRVPIRADARNEFAWASTNWDRGLRDETFALTNPVLVTESIDASGNVANDSNIGGDVAAPGDPILSTALGKDYVAMRGTSFAAPHVSALLGYLLADDPSLTLAQLRRKVLAFGHPARATRAVDFDWKLEDRTNRDDNGDGLVDYRTTKAALDPTSFRVDFDACDAGQTDVRPTGYSWQIEGATTDTFSCTFHHDFATEGAYPVTLTITGENGESSSVTKNVTVHDLLVLSLGDSLASGEGNPDVPGTTTGLLPARWESERCHRSADAGSAEAARWLEAADVHTSVTLLHLGCSGARITGDLGPDGFPLPGDPGSGGLLTPYEGIKAPNDDCVNSNRRDFDACLRPQVTEAKDLVGNRTPDALLLSIGANDMFFSTIVSDCILPYPFGSESCDTGKARSVFESRVGLLPGRYDQLATRIQSLFPDMPASHVFIAQYPDPTHVDNGSVDMSCLPYMTQQEANWASNTVVPALNQAVANAAEIHGWTLVKGLDTDFRTHGYCAQDSWIVRLGSSFENQGGQDGAFHPNFRGHWQYAHRIVETMRDTLGLNAPTALPQARDSAERIDAYASMLSNAGALKRLVDVNDESKDGNRRVIRDLDANGVVVTTPDTQFSHVPDEKTAPDGFVDMRDFRRFRDAYLESCLQKAVDDQCPAGSDVELDGADTHPKKDLNFDGCTRDEPGNPKGCDAKETDFSRFDFNGDGAVSVSKLAFVPLADDGSPAADRAEGTQQSDLALLRSQWSPNPKTSEGWKPGDLQSLVRSADLELHADAVFDEGASKAQVQVQHAVDGTPVGPERTMKRGNGPAILTVPLDSTTDEYVVVTTAETEKGTSQSVSQRLSLKYGEDRRVDLCPGISLRAEPTDVAADGSSTSTIHLALSSCDNRRDVDGKHIAWNLSPSTGGAYFDLTDGATDANGNATARFVAGTANQIYTVRASVDVGDGDIEEATIAIRTVRKLTIKYVWKQVYEDYKESGSTRWTNASPLQPDCAVPGVVDYCIDSSHVEISAPDQYGAFRSGTITGGGSTFKVTENVSNSVGATRDSWTTSAGGTTKTGEDLNQWFVTDPHAYENHFVDGLRSSELEDGIHLDDLAAVGNLPYHYALSTIRTGGDPSAPRPIELGALRTSMLLVPQGGAPQIRFAAGPGKEIVFPRAADGSYQPFASCGVLDDDLTTDPGYYVANTSDYIPGALSVGRKTDYVGGDRPMPVGPGHLRVRYAFAAVASYPGQTAPDPLLPDCSQNHPPTAAFSFTPQAPDEGHQVSFKDESTDVENDVSKWEWSFGDGSNDSGPSPYHLYKDNGTYDVTLTVTDAAGAKDTVTKQVVVANLPPEADLEADTAQVGQPLTVTYRLVDAGSIDKTQLEWSITSTNPAWPTLSGTSNGNVYTRPITGLPVGTYPLTLTVRDKDGGVATADATAVVTAGPPPPVLPIPDKLFSTCDANVKLDTEEVRFLDAVNDYRAENGLEPVHVSPTLNKAADAHAEDMAAHGFLSHTGSDGSMPWDRAWAAGYPRGAAISENIASGTALGRDALVAWRGSTAGHNENMINHAWHAIGISRVQGSGDWYWSTSYGDVLDCGKTSSSGLHAMTSLAADDGSAETTVPRNSGGVETVHLAPEKLAAPAAKETASANEPTNGLFYPPTPAFTISNAEPLEKHNVTFTNRSRDALGHPLAATIDFGDGSPTFALPPDEGVAHSYDQSDCPDVTVTATDSIGHTASVVRSVCVDPLPQPALFYTGPSDVVLGKKATLSAIAKTWYDGDRLAGLPITFEIGGISVSAVTDANGVAEADVTVTGITNGWAPLDISTPGNSDWAPKTLYTSVGVIQNTPPEANAGGPYLSGIGDALLLDGSLSTDADIPADSIASYAWDLNGDGVYDDATGMFPLPVNWNYVQSLVCGGTCVPGQVYTVSLRVTDTRGDSDTASATVRFATDFALSLGGETHTVVPNASNSFAVTVVGSQGFTEPVTLSIDGLPAGVTGEFSVNPVLPGHISVLTLTASADAATGEFPVTVAGTTPSGIRHTASDQLNVQFGLIPICYGTVSGTVTDVDTGEPLGDVSVGDSSGWTNTDASGRYILRNAQLGYNNAPQDHLVAMSKLGWWGKSGNGLAVCGATTKIDVALRRVRTGHVVGRVVEGVLDPSTTRVLPTDNPVPNAIVRTDLTQEHWPQTFNTDAAGNWGGELDLEYDNAPETYGLTASAPDYWWSSSTVTADVASTNERNFVLLKQCYGTLRGGRVTYKDTGEPAPFHSVVVWLNPDLPAYTTTDAQGNYSFDMRALLGYNNQSVYYPVQPLPDSSDPPGSEGERYKTLELVHCGDEANVDLQISRPSPVFAWAEGHVTDDRTNEPIAGANVHASSLPDGNATTDATGYYKVRAFLGYDVQSGSVTVGAQKLGFEQSSRTIALGKDQTATVDLTLHLPKTLDRTLKGVVRDAATGAPIPGAAVMGNRCGNGGPLICTWTDRDGAYSGTVALDDRLGPIAEGMTASAPDYWSQVKSVTLAPNTTTTQDFQLLHKCPSARIAGTVVNANTQAPIEAAYVATPTVSGFTDAAGHFLITDVQPGTNNQPMQVTVTASKSGFFSQTKNVTIFCGANLVVDFGKRESSNGIIVGKVTDTGTGNPLANTFIGTEFGKTTTTDANGNYRIENVPLGDLNADKAWQVTAAPTGYKQKTQTVVAKANVEARADFSFSTANAVPAAIPQALETDEDTALPVTLAGTDPDGDPLSFSVMRFPEHGALTGSGPTLHYAPDANWNGTDSFEFVANDGVAMSQRATVTIGVAPVNDAPVANEDRFDTTTGVALRIPVSALLANDTDVDGDTLTLAGVTQTREQPVHLEGDTVVFEPQPGFVNPSYNAYFTYGASDGHSGTATGVVLVKITDAPAAPTCPARTFQVTAGTQLTGTLACTDANGDPLTYSVADPPTQGTVDVQSNGAFTYMPPSGVTSGTVTFAYRASDGTLSSEPATVTIAILGGSTNAPPTAADDTATLDEDGSTVVDVLANDSPGSGEMSQHLTATLLGQPAHGVALATVAGISYTPAQDYNGTDTFGYQACDDGVPAKCAAATVTVTVAPVDDRPHAADGTASLDENAPPVAIDLGALVSDVETPDAGLTYEIVAGPKKGTLDGAGPIVHYAPAHGASGADSFTYRVVDRGDPDGCALQQACDAPLASDVHTIAITIASVNHVPAVTLDAAGPFPEGGSVALAAHGTDADGDALSYTWHAAGGTLDADGGGATLSAVDGPATIPVTVTVDDGTTTSTATTNVSVANVAPAVDAGADRSADEGSSVALAGAGFTDPGTQDTHAATVDWGDGTAPQPATIEGGAVHAEHAYTDNGVYTVSVRVVDNDGGAGTDTTTVTVHNLAPTVEAGSNASLDEGSSLALPPATYHDAGSLDMHSATVDWGDGTPPVAAPATGGNVAATHVYDDNGVYTATVTVTDDDGGAASDSFTVTVRNVAPTVDAGPDVVAPWGIPIAFVGTVSDPSGADTAAGLHPTWTFGDGSPPAAPAATTHAYDRPGTYAATLSASDKDGGRGSDDVAVRIVQRPTALAAAGTTSVPYGTVTLAARLTDIFDAPTARLDGRDVEFELAGTTYRAKTDANGTAHVSVTAPLAPGTYTLALRFVGDNLYLPSQATATIAVAASTTPGTVTGGALRSSANGRGGFNVHSDGETVKGELQYQSKSAGNFHASTITAMGVAADGRSAWFSGVGDDGRTFVTYVEDNGEPGNRDVWRLWISGRLETDGTLAGGNIQIHT